MAGKGQITSERASSQKIIRLQDAHNESKMAGKRQITRKSASSQKIIRLWDADNENKLAGKGQITSKRPSSQKIIRLCDAHNENELAGKENPVEKTTIVQCKRQLSTYILQLQRINLTFHLQFWLSLVHYYHYFYHRVSLQVLVGYGFSHSVCLCCLVFSENLNSLLFTQFISQILNV